MYDEKQCGENTMSPRPPKVPKGSTTNLDDTSGAVAPSQVQPSLLASVMTIIFCSFAYKTIRTYDSTNQCLGH